jgi:hypothetical protein
MIDQQAIFLHEKRGRLEPRSVQTKDNKIGTCYFSTKHAALRRKNKDRFARNQDNGSECGDKSIRGLLFQ